MKCIIFCPYESRIFHKGNLLHFYNDTPPIISYLFYLLYFCFQFKPIVHHLIARRSLKRIKNEPRAYPQSQRFSALQVLLPTYTMGSRVFICIIKLIPRRMRFPKNKTSFRTYIGFGGSELEQPIFWFFPFVHLSLQIPICSFDLDCKNITQVRYTICIQVHILVIRRVQQISSMKFYKKSNNRPNI